jgi:hypothetical protein
MEKMRTIARPRLVRNIALFWIVFGLAGAYGQAARAWTALVSGQTTLPLALHDPSPVVRTAEPLVFHATLLASLVIALAFLYAAYGAWRLRQAIPSAKRRVESAKLMRAR